MSDSNLETDPEFDAMRDVYAALKDLDASAQNRVLDYVLRRLSITRNDFEADTSGKSFSPRELAEEAAENRSADATPRQEDEIPGVSAVAQKWMQRNGLTATQLSKLFSLGLDEIDLVANSVPGKSTRQKMRSVLLLTGVAGYLGTGAPRTSYGTVKQALEHYNAYDSANFATNVKGFASEVAGSKETGYTLTARGLAGAAELILEMLKTK